MNNTLNILAFYLDFVNFPFCPYTRKKWTSWRKGDVELREESVRRKRARAAGIPLAECISHSPLSVTSVLMVSWQQGQRCRQVTPARGQTGQVTTLVKSSAAGLVFYCSCSMLLTVQKSHLKAMQYGLIQLQRLISIIL